MNLDATSQIRFLWSIINDMARIDILNKILKELENINSERPSDFFMVLMVILMIIMMIA